MLFFIKDFIQNATDVIKSRVEKLSYEEIFLKFIDYNLLKRDNQVFYFLLSDTSKIGLTHSAFDYFSYFMKNLSAYQLLRLYEKSKITKVEEINNNIINKLLRGLKIIEYFSIFCKAKDDDQVTKIPYVNFSISLLYHKTENIAKSCKINILSFNKELFNFNWSIDSSSYYESQKYSTRFTIFHKMLKSLSEEDLEMYGLSRNSNIYNVLKLENEDIIFDKKFIKNSEFKDLLQFLNFKEIEISFIIRILALILHISNLSLEKFSQNKNDFNLDYLRNVLRLNDPKEFEKILFNNIKVTSSSMTINEKNFPIVNFSPEEQFNQEEFHKNKIFLMENLYER